MSSLNDPQQMKVDPNNPTQRALQGILARELMNRFAYGPPASAQPQVTGAPNIHQQLYGASFTPPPSGRSTQPRYDPQFMGVVQRLLEQGLRGSTDDLPSGTAQPGQGYTQGPNSQPTGRTAKRRTGGPPADSRETNPRAQWHANRQRFAAPTAPASPPPQVMHELMRQRFMLPTAPMSNPIVSGSRMMNSYASAYGGSRTNPRLANFRMR